VVDRALSDPGWRRRRRSALQEERRRLFDERKKRRDQAFANTAAREERGRQEERWHRTHRLPLGHLSGEAWEGQREHVEPAQADAAISHDPGER